jgi:hypothetical protein
MISAVRLSFRNAGVYVYHHLLSYPILGEQVSQWFKPSLSRFLPE